MHSGGTTKQLLRLLLRPALRVAMRKGIGANEVFDSVKRELVGLAASELKKSGEKVTISRLSLMSGVNRKEVTRIHRNLDDSDEESRSIVTRVLGQWENDPRFQTAAGKPRVLKYSGENSEFGELVETVSTDVGQATVLFELCRIGAAETTARGVKLLQPEQELESKPERVLDLLSRDTDTLVSVVEDNIYNTPDPRHPHSRTEYDNIFESDLPQIRKWLSREAALFHQKVRKYLSKHDKDLNPEREEPAGARVVLGSFAHSKPRPEALPESSEES